ncbi:MAG: hypothetical protein PHR38_09735, partial [Bacteroidales bacterium]|nr:hypothetical protein [Bacteroidales bacterium]MDD4713477.1 hypothetical protein [Bacteroidales bacterium]
MKKTFLLFVICCCISQAGAQQPYKLYTFNKYFEENSFVKAPQDTCTPPSFQKIREKLPQPFWTGNPDAIRCYWKAW